ncbi:MAG: polysaccharide biosynthesis C-terminal domain-containing protein, partial [Planctomycetota bacterium]
GGYLIVLGPNFLEAWIGESYSPIAGRVLQVLMASFFFFLPVRGVALPVLMGLGHARVPGFGLLAMGALNLVLSLLLVGPYGIMGVAVGTAIPNILFSALFVFEACKRVDMRIGEWLRYALGRLLPVTILSCGALALVSSQVPLHGFPSVIAAGIAYTALFGALTIGFVFRDDPFLDTRALTNKVRARFR